MFDVICDSLFWERLMLQGRLKGKEGIFPPNYVSEMKTTVSCMFSLYMEIYLGQNMCEGK